MKIKILKGNRFNYEITEYGEVFQISKKSKRKLTGTISKNGYVIVTLGGSRKYLHRIIAQNFCPNPKGKPCVNHKNGIKTDNSANNLEWVTYSENHLHAYKNLNRRTPLGKDYGGGVCFDKSRNKYMVYTGSRKTRKYHGRFSTKSLALRALKKVRFERMTNESS